MPKDEIVMSVRIPKALAERLDALVDTLASGEDATMTGERVSRSMMIRRALLEGVKALERRHKR